MGRSTPNDRTPSHWGWGWADRFPGRIERLKLAARLKVGLGFGLGLPRNPRRLAAVELPTPRVSLPGSGRGSREIAIPDALAERVSDRPEDRIRSAYGRAYRDIVRGFRGDFSGAPDLVARPEDETDVAAILDWAGEAELAVVPRGGGTNVVGATECSEAGDRGVLVLAIASATLEDHGATITHHHAVGRIHREAYLRQIPAPTLAALRAAKAAVDPRNLLNPGTLFTR